MKLYIINSTFVDVPIETYKLLQSCITYSSIKYKWQKLRPNQLKQKENFWAQPKSTAFWFDLRLIFFKAWNKVVRKSQLFSVSKFLPYFLSGGSVFRTVSPLMVTKRLPPLLQLLPTSVLTWKRKSFPDDLIESSRYLEPGYLSWDMCTYPNQHCYLEGNTVWCAVSHVLPYMHMYIHIAIYSYIINL